MATQWWRIKAAFLKDDKVTYKELAEKYKLSERTIRNRASKEGWRNERDKIETNVGQAIRARAEKSRVEQLEKLITANERMAEALMKLTEEIQNEPLLLMGGKKDGKLADSISKAIQTTIQSQRDLHKLPTLDQDMRRKEEAQRKREAKAKMELDREKWALVKQEKDNEQAGAAGAKWKIELPDELTVEGGEIDV